VDWIGLIVGGAAVLAFLGTGTVFVLSGRQKGRIDALEAQNKDLRNDRDDRDQRILFLEAENEAKTEKIKDLETHVIALEKMKMGEAYFSAMHDQVEAHTVRVLANHTKILGELEVVRAQNRDMLALLADHRNRQRLFNEDQRDRQQRREGGDGGE
jgi:hypothetical protein